MTQWKLIIDRLDGQSNMQKDIKLFNDVENSTDTSILRIYSWSKPCISLGYSQKIDEEIDISKAKEMGWDVVVRPTGGGIVFHNESEVTYTLITSIDNPILPKGLVPSYKKISEAIVVALRNIGIRSEILNTKYETLNKSKTQNSNFKTNLCFSYPTEYEIVVDGKKIVGSAQKRGKKALLQQGSIFMSPTDEQVFSVLKKPYEEHNAVSVEEILGRKVGLDEMAEALKRGFNEIFGI